MIVTATLLPHGFHNREFSTVEVRALVHDTHVHGTTCVHVSRDGKVCTANARLVGQHGWLCSVHEAFVNPKAKVITT